MSDSIDARRRKLDFGYAFLHVSLKSLFLINIILTVHFIAIGFHKSLNLFSYILYMFNHLKSICFKGAIETDNV